MSIEKPLVSVVVPAYNAVATLAATLDSVLAQTYENLEVLVVDDGSKDQTADMVLGYRARDVRVNLVRQQNGGVAAARNTGIQAGRGDYVAPVDSDDIWHPTKIEKQMNVMLAGGPDMALVYSPWRTIDEDGGVIGTAPIFGCEGWVLCQHIYVNIVGNGSGALMRRSVVLELGGYDPRLRDWGAQGCEDLLLQLRIASCYQFGCAPEYLVGYRKLPGAMSTYLEPMFNSYRYALEMVYANCPNVPGFIGGWGLANLELRLLPGCLRKREFGRALSIIGRSLRRDFVTSSLKLLGAGPEKALDAAQSIRRHLSPQDSDTKPYRRPFYDFHPSEEPSRFGSRLFWDRMKMLEAMDRKLGPCGSLADMRGLSEPTGVPTVASAERRKALI